MSEAGEGGYTRDELLALTPARYLARGWLGADGRPLPGLAAEFAVAASTQLLAAEMPAQELAFTYEALKMLLDGEDGTPEARARDALDEALATVARMIQQANNKGLATWLDECVAAIRLPADIDALLEHMRAVLRLYSVIASLPEPDEQDSPDSFSGDVSPPEPDRP